MTEPPGSLVTEAVRSLEVRWIFPGEVETEVVGWFGRFPARAESREDTYLLDPPLPGLSVKVRGCGTLEVKVYRGSPGMLEVAGRARGRMEFWQKWSFPFRPRFPGYALPRPAIVPAQHPAGLTEAQARGGSARGRSPASVRNM